MEKNIVNIVNKRNELTEELIGIKASIETNPRSVRELSKRAKEVVFELDEIQKIFETTATFNTKEFARFMRSVLLFTEGNFQLTGIFQPDKKYYVIGNEAVTEFLKNEIHSNEDIEKFINGNQDPDTTILSDDTTFPFKQNLKMKKCFSKYRRLRLAIYELIQLKLDNPEIEDKDRFDRILNRILSENLKKSYLSSIKKSQQ